MNILVNGQIVWEENADRMSEDTAAFVLAIRVLKQARFAGDRFEYAASRLDNAVEHLEVRLDRSLRTD